MTTEKKKDPLFRLLHHLWRTNSSDRKYQVYKHRAGIRIDMKYSIMGAYEIVAALGDIYPKKKEPALDFTTDVRITSGPLNPPKVLITILPSPASWVWKIIKDGETLCDLDNLVHSYDTNIDIDPLRKEVLDRLK